MKTIPQLTRFETAIQNIGDQFKVPHDLICSIIMVESSGNPWAARFEPAYKYLYKEWELSKTARVSLDTMIVLQKTSWGLMQVMGGKAYEMGLNNKDLPHILCVPEIGIEFGVKILAKDLNRYGNETEAIAAYNAGSAIKNSQGFFINQQYVNKVERLLSSLRGF